MNQNYRDRLKEMRDENPTSATQNDNAHYKTFDSVSHVRNLCFIWPDGKRKFLNYAYMVSGDYSPDHGRITLVFTSETIILEGIRLNLLFGDLLRHIPFEITMIDKRYIETLDVDDFAIFSIETID